MFGEHDASTSASAVVFGKDDDCKRIDIRRKIDSTNTSVDLFFGSFGEDGIGLATVTLLSVNDRGQW